MRRVFYIDVGDITVEKAQEYVKKAMAEFNKNHKDNL